MGKGYKNKTCVYCAKPNASTTADHIFAREFFLVADRANLPKAPACSACNGEKSTLEHYLTAVLPFGGRLSNSSAVLETMVPPRLGGNQKLRRDLVAGQTRELSEEGGVVQSVMALPFDPNKLSCLFQFIVRGLMVHHFGVQLPPECSVGAGTLSNAGEAIVRPLLERNGAARIKASIGGGAFEYEGVQATDNPLISVWRFSIYGGVKLMGDPDLPGETASAIWSVSSPKAIPGLFG